LIDSRNSLEAIAIGIGCINPIGCIGCINPIGCIGCPSSDHPQPIQTPADAFAADVHAVLRI
jgi:hypothetical protein